jgi:NAD(P)-dependent dehydrogenase (short-subunit alcohol dehydrogenase family)
VNKEHLVSLEHKEEKDYLKGKVAIVSGASRGIGRVIALELSSLGADIVITARDVEKLTEVASSIREQGSRAEIVTGDLQRRDFAQTVVDSALKAFGQIDILVNSAGATKRGNFLELTDDDWADGFELKLFGAARLCRAAWPHLLLRKGAIINIAGAGGRTADIPFAVGGSVNAAMNYFTKVLAEIGIADGIQVNCINPGWIRTDRFQKRIEVIQKQHGIGIDEATRKLQEHYRLTKIGAPEDVAALVAFILSSPGRLLHGAILDMDAGMTKGL